MHAVTLLDPAAVTIEGVRFIGATLWTDFRLDGIAAEPGAHLRCSKWPTSTAQSRTAAER